MNRNAFTRIKRAQTLLHLTRSHAPALLMASHLIDRWIFDRFSVSTGSREELEAACAAVEQAALQSSCELRRLAGQQAQAFTAAALPFCRGL